MSDPKTPVVIESKAFSLVPSSLAEAEKIAGIIARSDLIPKDFKDKPQNVFVAIQWGQEVGLKPMQSLQNIAVINGRPSIYGDAALALVMAHPDFEDIEEKIEGAGDARTATCMIKRKGRTPVTRTFSVTQAKTAKLWSKQGPWTDHPDRMQQMRARGFCMRDSFPDALKGLNLVEESQDIEPEKDITPAKPAIVMPTAKAEPKAEAPKAEPQVIEGEYIPAKPEQTETVEQTTGEIKVGTKASENQLKVIRGRLGVANVTEQALCDAFFLNTLEELPANAVSEASKWIKARVPA